MTDIDMNMLPDYLVEAAEHLEEIEGLLLQLVEQPDNTELLDEIFRPIHSIKGAAQFIGLERSSRLAHRLEDLLDLLRKGQRSSSAEVVELLMTARDQIAGLAEELEQSQSEISSIDDIVAQLTCEIENSGVSDSELPRESLDISDVSEPASETAPTTNELDENDQELLNIFLENLREKIDQLHTQAAEFENATDKVVLLARCTENLQALQSAANYMGYVELSNIYSNWLEDIGAVEQALVNNEDVPNDFMDGYLAEVVSLIPRLEGSDSIQSSAVVSPEPVDEDAEAVTETNNEDSSTIDMSLLADYLIEAAEHLEEMELQLLLLADAPEDTDLLNEIFRPIHSIKGAAQFTGLDRSSRLAHRLEDMLDLLRNGERASSPEIVELLISARDLIACLAVELENTQSETSSIDDIVLQIVAIIEATDSTVSDTDAIVDTDDDSASATVCQAYEEENDQELFGIFFENLREKIDQLRSQASGLENASDKSALLDRCVENLKTLHSAANYMGYQELTSLYVNWLEDIDAVQQALVEGEDVPYDFMDGYVSEIKSLFPQLDEVAENVSAYETVQQETAQQETVETEVNADADDSEDDLHKQLSEALNVASSRTDDGEYEVLHGVFEEMVSEVENISDEPHLEAVVNSSEPAEQASTPVTIEKQENRQSERRTDDNDQRNVDRRSNESVLKKSVRVEAEKIDSLINQVGELVVDRAFFYTLYDDMRGLQKHFKDDIGLDQKEMKQIRAFTYRMGEAIASLSRTSNELQEGVMKVRMLPISQLFNRYPRLVHDLTRNNNKKVNLEVEGEDTELDKMVVEKLSDPLIHIIRNAVDHGLENAEERAAAEKPETGTLHLRSYHESNQVVVEIKDDGRGIDPAIIKAKAIEKGIVSKEEADRMTTKEIIRLITTAGFSTANEITDTSGRGVGMDIVRKNIEKLNGTMEIDSNNGEGTTIRLKIPLTLAIIPAHMVRVGRNMYTIPLANIEETLRINKSETTIIEGTEVVYLRGKTLPIIHLSNLFTTDSDAKDEERFYVVVVNTGSQKLGLVVDELMGQEEVVIKPLIDYLRDKSGFSGATIVGDGTISLILDIYEIASMTAEKQARRQQQLIMARSMDDASGMAAG